MGKKAVIAIWCLAVIIIDQLTKLFIRLNLGSNESVPIIKNIFHLTYVTNTGSAFGLFKGLNLIFIIISIIVIFIIIYSIRKIDYKKNLNDKIELILLSLLLGGVIGNLLDRLFFGHVIDFIDLRIWPVFNVADSIITLSVIGLIYTHWRKQQLFTH